MSPNKLSISIVHFLIVTLLCQTSIKLNEREEIGVMFSFNLFPRTPLIAIKMLFNKQNLSLVLM